MKFLKLYEKFDTLKGMSYYRRGETHVPDYISVRKIIDGLRDGTIPSASDNELLDRVSGYPNFYNSVSNWLKERFDIFKKYSYEDMEDRLCEFFDEIPKFIPKTMFTLTKKGSSMGIRSDKLNDKLYFIKEIGHIMGDILYNCTSNKMTIDEYFSLTKCGLHIMFNREDYTTTSGSYNLIKLEEICDRIIKRFNQLYDTDGFEYRSNPREGRLYDNDRDVYDYDFVIYLK